VFDVVSLVLQPKKILVVRLPKHQWLVQSPMSPWWITTNHSNRSFWACLYSQFSIIIDSLSYNIMYNYIYIILIYIYIHYIYTVHIPNGSCYSGQGMFFLGRPSLPPPEKKASETSIGVTMADGGWRINKSWINSFWENVRSMANL